MAENILGRLSGGPLDGQIIPLETETPDDELTLPWDSGHLLYKRAGDAENTGAHDGPTTVPYRFDTAI
jgi:hypothetical protein